MNSSPSHRIGVLLILWLSFSSQAGGTLAEVCNQTVHTCSELVFSLMQRVACTYRSITGLTEREQKAAHESWTKALERVDPELPGDTRFFLETRASFAFCSRFDGRVSLKLAQELRAYLRSFEFLEPLWTRERAQRFFAEFFDSFEEESQHATPGVQDGILDSTDKDLAIRVYRRRKESLRPFARQIFSENSDLQVRARLLAQALHLDLTLTVLIADYVPIFRE